MDFDTSREWLETNGIGGFASSTVIGCNTRRYHALLCAATRPPLGRMVLVNKVDESLTVNDRCYELGCNQYPGIVHPTGHTYLREFTAAPLPRWIYTVPCEWSRTGETLLEKTLWMPHGQNRTIVRYSILSGDGAILTVRPYLSGRDYHHVQRHNDSFNTECRHDVQEDSHHVYIQPYPDCPPIVLSHDGDFYEKGDWYYNFQYAIEQERGLECLEDAYSPGAFVWQLMPGETALFIASSGVGDETVPQQDGEGGCDTPSEHRKSWFDIQIARRDALSVVFNDVPEHYRDVAKRLSNAADQFIVRRAQDRRYTIIAGYPWFTDWGRDTMIALPGLCLTTKRFYEAASILLSFASSASEGMIPNRFPDAGEIPDYNTVDATLWFFHATERYLETSGDWKTVQGALYPVLKDCVEWHLRGTRYGIRADAEDGLLWSGEAGSQLTWMDAKVGDWVVTPRVGKPVEIQALWFNALCTLSAFAERAGDDQTMTLCDEWIAKIKVSFFATFWNEESSCLYDCVNGSSKDGAIRPNQILAVSLPHRLLEPEYEERVVETVERELRTPYGLRSLSPRDSHYRGIYQGDQWQRDGSYHQGTVWSWLIGPFLTAYLRTNKYSAESREQALEWLEPLLDHLDQACIGSVSEIFDGDAPHLPRGCFAQAWGVGEVLRVLVDELKPAAA